jgi:hypothetical protein
MKHNNKLIHQKGGKEKMWYESVYKGFLIASVWVFLFSFGFTGETRFNATITGYSLLIISISLILIILLYNVAKNNQQLSVVGSIFNVFINGGPYIIMLFLMCVILSIMITYKSEIIAGTVSSGYTSFSNISMLLFMTQIYVIYNAMESNSFQTTGKLTRIVAGIAYLLDLLEALCAIILFIILKYFTTDG